MDGAEVVMCKPSLAQMPWLRPGLRGLRPSQSMGQARALNGSQLRLGSGSSPGFSHINMSVSVQRVYVASVVAAKIDVFTKNGYNKCN